MRQLLAIIWVAFFLGFGAPASAAGIGTADKTDACLQNIDTARGELCLLAEANRISNSAQIWGLSGAVISLLTLASVIAGFALNNQTVKLEHRAYIRLDVVSAAFLENRSKIAVSYRLTNYGRTPAFYVKANSRLGASPDGRKDIHYLREDAFLQKAVHPGDPDFVTIILENGFSETVTEMIALGTNVVRLVVDVNYTDPFGKFHYLFFLQKFVGLEVLDDGTEVLKKNIVRDHVRTHGEG